MFVHRYWARGHARVPSDEYPWDVAAVRSSDESLADAQRRAGDAARKAAEHIARHGPYERVTPFDGDPEGYWYAARSSAEELIEEVPGTGAHADDAGRAAAITRNCYGALVLNAAAVPFVDVDDPPKAGGLLGRLGFGGRDERMVGAVERVARREPSLRFEVFHTAGGYRVMVTGRPFDPTGDETERLMRDLGADPLYARLCGSQRSFRARLTPKPWRLVPPVGEPPVRYPFASDDEEARMREWEIRYHEASEGAGICTPLAVRGDDREDTDARAVVARHARAVSQVGTPLA